MFYLFIYWNLDAVRCLCISFCSPVVCLNQAEFVPNPDPSLTEQYEYANEHDIKCLVIITDTGVAHKGSVKVISTQQWQCTSK